MDGYDEGTYGRAWAPYYDDIFDTVDDAVIDLLLRHAGSPPRALELAVGTGRIAMPLAERGVEVVGIEVSPEMVDVMRTKGGGEVIKVVMGDFADVAVEGRFPLVYLAFNTLFALLSQERQIDCFQNVADHLEDGGRFILDCFVPDLTRFDRYNTRLGVSSIVSPSEHRYELSIHDPVGQRISSHMVKRNGDGSSVVLPVEVRYAWPAEMDLMARLAGLELEDRFGWYDLRPFNERSTSHMSIYVKPG
jgi:SAM-dependent methyltransferase